MRVKVKMTYMIKCWWLLMITMIYLSILKYDSLIYFLAFIIYHQFQLRERQRVEMDNHYSHHLPVCNMWRKYTQLDKSHHHHIFLQLHHKSRVLGNGNGKFDPQVPQCVSDNHQIHNHIHNCMSHLDPKLFSVARFFANGFFCLLLSLLFWVQNSLCF